MPYPPGQAAHPQGPPVDDFANMFPAAPTFVPQPPGGGNGGGGGHGHGGGDEDEDDGAAMDELSRRLESLKGRASRA